VATGAKAAGAEEGVRDGAAGAEAVAEARSVEARAAIAEAEAAEACWAGWWEVDEGAFANAPRYFR
jgi:hypothetical protein